MIGGFSISGVRRSGRNHDLLQHPSLDSDMGHFWNVDFQPRNSRGILVTLVALANFVLTISIFFGIDCASVTTLDPIV